MKEIINQQGNMDKKYISIAERDARILGKALLKVKAEDTLSANAEGKLQLFFEIRKNQKGK